MNKNIPITQVASLNFIACGSRTTKDILEKYGIDCPTDEQRSRVSKANLYLIRKGFLEKLRQNDTTIFQITAAGKKATELGTLQPKKEIAKPVNENPAPVAKVKVETKPAVKAVKEVAKVDTPIADKATDEMHAAMALIEKSLVNFSGDIQKAIDILRTFKQTTVAAKSSGLVTTIAMSKPKQMKPLAPAKVEKIKEVLSHAKQEAKTVKVDKIKAVAKPTKTEKAKPEVKAVKKPAAKAKPAHIKVDKPTDESKKPTNHLCRIKTY